MTKRVVLALLAILLATFAWILLFSLRNRQPDGLVAAEGNAPSSAVGAAAPPRELSFPPTSEVAPPEAPEVARFLTIEAPERVVERKRMPVLVSLTENEASAGTEILFGARTAEGRLLFRVGEVQVVLAAPAFDIQEAIQTLSVPAQGDSTQVLFELVARPIEAPELETRVHVSFWWHGARIASAVRHVTILREDSSKPAQLGAAPTPTAFSSRSSAPVWQPPQPPDLTLDVWSDEGRQGFANVTVASLRRQTPRQDVWPLEDLRAWLETHMARVAGTSRGVSGAAVEAASRFGSPEGTLADWNGLGRELYRRLAPPVFQQMFWDLADELGADFRTIQIHTNLPWIPWELMRPCRPDGSDERGFLGAELSIGRWHFSDRTALLAPPPQRPRMQEVVVIAPRYADERRLPAQDQELEGLRRQAHVSVIPGQLGALRQLLSHLPQALVHFAGHGVVDESTAGIPTYSIVLEDGPLDLTTWLGMSPARFPSHPFFFFNSCDVGRSERVANFVEGWAPALLELGASGYIGSLVPIDDAGASSFAIEFYSRLYRDGPLRGHVADALRETRCSFLEHGDPIGLVYVFYGDPNLALQL